MKRFLLLSSALAAAISWNLYQVHAADRGPKGGRQQPKDRDVARAGAQLRQWDRNGDMTIDVDEAGAAFEALLERSREATGLRGPARRWDVDGNGALSEEERKRARADFNRRLAAMSQQLLQRLDTDGDGVLSAAEKAVARKQLRGRHKAAPGEAGGSLLRAWDTNDDLIIDAAELAAGLDELKARVQASPVPLPEGLLGRGPLADVDLDGDGRLSAAELTGATEKISDLVRQRNRMIAMHADADHDGIISEAEREAGRRRSAEAGRRAGRGGHRAGRDGQWHDQPGENAPPHMQ